MFKAKPDLVICYSNKLIVIEAKYTQEFDEIQLKRTEDISKIWAKLFYEDLGYTNEPELFMKTLGLKRMAPDITWEDVLKIASKYWSNDDFSIQSLNVENKIRRYLGGD